MPDLPPVPGNIAAHLPSAITYLDQLFADTRQVFPDLPSDEYRVAYVWASLEQAYTVLSPEGQTIDPDNWREFLSLMVGALMCMRFDQEV